MLSVTVPVGSSAEVNIPIVANLGQTQQNFVVSEGNNGKVWANGKFYPGAGILGATWNDAGNGVTVQVTSGHFKFMAAGETQ